MTRRRESRSQTLACVLLRKTEQGHSDFRRQLTPSRERSGKRNFGNVSMKRLLGRREEEMIVGKVLYGAHRPPRG